VGNIEYALLGATGAVGKALAEKLADRGRSLKASRILLPLPCTQAIRQS
jgi:hypothetical protein